MNSISHHLFFLVGIMGCGKSFSGKRIAAMMGYSFIDLDNYIEKKEGKNIVQIFKEDGERSFRKKELEALENIIQNTKHKTIIATGGGTPCFNNCMNIMNENGVTIWIDEEMDVVAERLYNENNLRPLIAGKSKDEIRNTINALNEERKLFYKQSTHSFTSSKTNFENIINIIKQYE